MYFQYFELLPSESWSLSEYFSLITQKYKNAKRRIFLQIINIAKNLLDNQSRKVDLLKEENFKLVVEIDRLRKENVEIPELRNKNSEFSARIVELEHSAKENAENAKLRYLENAKISKLKQKHALIRTPNDAMKINQFSAPSIRIEPKSLDDKETKEFLERQNGTVEVMIIELDGGADIETVSAKWSNWSRRDL
ncbi:hypothetical protein Glove_364g65 [Diversispora epigaea]|uniref:Uncharacterized protein n=1 Tax=Diversispora epigaea TaxID=1348612 RepID=A0A397HFW4_9GLOM|nr:hypothetical protein Glove_364g65 [Diversispora epigaea]